QHLEVEDPHVVEDHADLVVEIDTGAPTALNLGRLTATLTQSDVGDSEPDGVPRRLRARRRDLLLGDERAGVRRSAVRLAPRGSGAAAQRQHSQQRQRTVHRTEPTVREHERPHAYSRAHGRMRQATAWQRAPATRSFVGSRLWERVYEISATVDRFASCS